MPSKMVIGGASTSSSASKFASSSSSSNSSSTPSSRRRRHRDDDLDVDVELDNDDAEDEYRPTIITPSTASRTARLSSTLSRTLNEEQKEQQHYNSNAPINNNHSIPHANHSRTSLNSSAFSSSSTSSSPTTMIPLEEANRFRACIDEAIEKLELLGLITSDSLRRRKDPQQTSRTRKDIFSLMIRQKDLECMYEDLMRRRSQLRGLSNKSKYLANQARLNEITQALKESTATITANLKDHPTIVGNLNKIQKDRSSLVHLLEGCVNELASTRSFDSLIANVAQRSAEQRELSDTRAASVKKADALKNLECELEREWDEFERAQDSYNIQIKELTDQLKHLKKMNTLTLRYEQQTAISKAETIARLRKTRLSELREKISLTKNDLKTDRRVNKRTIAFLTRQKEELDHRYDEWENKYQEDYGALCQEYDSLTDTRNREQEILIATQARWEQDKKEKIARMDEMRMREEEEKDAKILAEKQYLAQCRIRFAWRVYWRKRKKYLKKMRRRRLARLRAQKKAASAFPMAAMQKRAAEAAQRKAERSARQGNQSA